MPATSSRLAESDGLASAAVDRAGGTCGRSCPSPGSLVDLDVTAALRDDAVDDREPEAGPLADALGREERLEDAREHVRRHAARRCR